MTFCGVDRMHVELRRARGHHCKSFRHLPLFNINNSFFLYMFCVEWMSVCVCSFYAAIVCCEYVIAGSFV
jgi:hypothetical protein